MATNEFEGYEKIYESSSDWMLDKTDLKSFKRTLWCVTEKIHGANFSFLIDENGERIRCGKRTGLLDEDDDFFGYKIRLFNQIRPKLKPLFDQVKEDHPTMDALYVFGELFGGHYPHDAIEQRRDLTAIQTGIWYSAEIEFCAFDVAIRVNEKKIYLDYEYAMKCFEAAKIFYAQPLFIGRYEETLNYPIEFQSTIASKLGYPALSQDNKAEGIVIRAMNEFQVKTSKGHSIRPMLKRKIVEFSEEKYSQSEKQEVRRNYQMKDFDLIRFEIDALITENRLETSLSKVGHVTMNDKEKAKELLRIYLKDVMDQLFENGNEEMWRNLSSNERDMLTDEMTLNVKKLILKYLKKQTQTKGEDEE